MGKWGRVEDVNRRQQRGRKKAEVGGSRPPYVAPVIDDAEQLFVVVVVAATPVAAGARPRRWGKGSRKTLFAVIGLICAPTSVNQMTPSKAVHPYIQSPRPSAPKHSIPFTFLRTSAERLNLIFLLISVIQ